MNAHNWGMKILCVVCELWLVEPIAEGGQISYWCERCNQQSQNQVLENLPIDK
jgi:hypothetical protein